MKKKLTVLLSFVLVVAVCCITLIGCTPSNPGSFLAKWSDGKNISIMESFTEDNLDDVVIEDKASGEETSAAGKITTEETYIKNDKNMMYKKVEILNIKENGKEDGKFEKTDTIIPSEATIVEYAKDGKINIYTYSYDWKVVKEKVSKDGDKNEKFKFAIDGKGEWVAIQIEKAEDDPTGMIDMLTGIFEKTTSSAKVIAENFDKTFTKGKGGVYTQNEKIDGYGSTLKVKSGNLVVDMLNNEDKVIATSTYDLNNKITIPSGAKEALTKFLETKEGEITNIENKSGANVYTVKIDGKEYKMNSKVLGYDLIGDKAVVGSKVAVWLNKGFFGYSIKEFLGFV